MENNRGTLVGLPESGMGFQIIRARSRGNSLFGLVVNAELFIDFGELPEVNTHSYDELQELIRTAQSLESPLEDLYVLQAFAQNVPPSSDEAPGIIDTPVSAGGSLAPSPRWSRATTDHEGFVRFSAFSKDWRILDNGVVAQNTYATTVGDARFAVSGLAVAGRYALPNPLPAIYAYTIVPGAGVPFLAGTTAPANGQAGGGVEVCFTDQKKIPPGAAFNRPYKIPER